MTTPSLVTDAYLSPIDSDLLEKIRASATTTTNNGGTSEASFDIAQLSTLLCQKIDAFSHSVSTTQAENF